MHALRWWVVGLWWMGMMGSLAAEDELHLVQADSTGQCRQGSAYYPDFGAVKLDEMNQHIIGVHYCLTPEAFQRIKAELGEANVAQAPRHLPNQPKGRK